MNPTEKSDLGSSETSRPSVKMRVSSLKTRLFVYSALFVTRRPKQTRRSLTGDTTKARSSPANRLMRSDHFRGCTYYNFSFSSCFSLPAFIRMKSLWVMNEAVCFPAAVLHYPAIVCVIRARARPELKPCQVAVMRRRVQVRVSKVKVQGGVCFRTRCKPRLIFPPPSLAIYITHVFYCTTFFSFTTSLSCCNLSQ